MASLRATAFHEAGHAAVLLFFRRRFQYLTVIADGNVAGHLLHHTRPDDCRSLFSRVPHWIDIELMCLLAGCVAQKKAAPSSVKGFHSENDYLQCANYLGGPGSEHYIEYCLARVKEMFSDEITWAGVEALAGALIERRKLRYLEAKKIVLEAQAVAFAKEAARLPQPDT